MKLAFVSNSLAVFVLRDSVFIWRRNVGLRYRGKISKFCWGERRQNEGFWVSPVGFKKFGRSENPENVDVWNQTHHL